MRNLIAGLVISIPLTVAAGTSSDSVHSIVKGNVEEPHIIKFQSGKVIFLEYRETKKLHEYEALLLTHHKRSVIQKSAALFQEEFEPTKVQDSELSTIFNRMNPYMKRKSECSDRAHVWAWDEFQKSGVNSEKVFLLLTDTYIRRNRYKWWFHVAPLYTSISGEKIVMDAQFLNRPVPFNEWKNLLVFSQRECVTDFRFLDYDAGADQSQDCYVKFEPMYYYVPGDIGSQEMGKPRTSWNTSQLNSSRTRAFFKGSN